MRVSIRVKPGSARTCVAGDHRGALVVAVSAPPVDGRATEAALRALAEELGVRRKDVTLVTGVTSRTKVVEIAVPDAVVAAEKLQVIERLRAGPPS